MNIPHRVVGSGPHHVLAMHGWFGCAERWGPFPDYLDTDALTVHFVDHRGYGSRKAETGTYSLDEWADDMLAVADAAGIEEFSLLGHSMGAAGTLKVLAKARGRVRRLVGLTPVGASPTPFDDDGRALFFGAPTQRENRFAIVNITTGSRLTPRFVDGIVDASLERSTLEAFTGAVHAWTGADFLDDVRGADLPILVIPGEHDPALGEATVNQTWKPHFPNCEVRVMPNAGHYPMFETPVTLATWVNEFLSR